MLAQSGASRLPTAPFFRRPLLDAILTIPCAFAPHSLPYAPQRPPLAPSPVPALLPPCSPSALIPPPRHRRLSPFARARLTSTLDHSSSPKVLTCQGRERGRSEGSESWTGSPAFSCVPFLSLASPATVSPRCGMRSSVDSREEAGGATSMAQSGAWLLPPFPPSSVRFTTRC